MEYATMQNEESYVRRFTSFEDTLKDNGEAWLMPIRETAISRFKELGFPSRRDEQWRFTNISPISKTPFKLSEPGESALAASDIDGALVPGLEGARLVFVEGYFSDALSSIGSLPDGVMVKSLKDALSSERELVEKHLTRYVDLTDDAFSALNTAFMQDGLFVFVPRGIILEAPIYALYVSTAAAAPTISHPRNLIVLEESAEASVVEDYVSLDSGGVHFSNVVTELVAGENSTLNHYLLERENDSSFNVSTFRIEQQRDSAVASHTALIGGSLVRNNIHPVLAGEGADCLINGVFMGRGTQHMDNFMMVEHASPHCNSRQFYYGVLDDKSRGVFSGRIVVHKDAQKTDAKQTNRNLLLSDAAQVDTKPQLEIYADDVKCTHGATIGQINKDALFYLRTRGIPEDGARSILLVAFAGECIERMPLEPVREFLQRIVTDWFRVEIA